MVQNIKEGGGRGVARWNNNQLINGNCVLGSLGFYQTHGRVINIESRVWAPIMEWFGAETVPTVSQSLARSDAEVTIELSTNFAKFHNILAKKNLSRHYRVSSETVYTLILLFSLVPDHIQKNFGPFFNSSGDEDFRTHLTLLPTWKKDQVIAQNLTGFWKYHFDGRFCFFIIEGLPTLGSNFRVQKWL